MTSCGLLTSSLRFLILAFSTILYHQPLFLGPRQDDGFRWSRPSIHLEVPGQLEREHCLAYFQLPHNKAANAIGKRTADTIGLIINETNPAGFVAKPPKIVKTYAR